MASAAIGVRPILLRERVELTVRLVHITACPPFTCSHIVSQRVQQTNKPHKQFQIMKQISGGPTGSSHCQGTTQNLDLEMLGHPRIRSLGSKCQGDSEMCRDGVNTDPFLTTRGAYDTYT